MSPVTARPLSIRDGIDHFVSAAEELTRARVDEPLFLTSLRREALAAFTSLGFPTTQNENWRYTNLAPLARIPFSPAPEPGLPERTAALAIDRRYGLGSRLVFVNGHLAADWSAISDLHAGVTVSSLSVALAEKPELIQKHLGRHAAFQNEAFLALNTALFSGGAFLHVPKGVALTEPLRFTFLSTAGGAPAMVHPRVLIVLEEGAQASVVETYASDAGVLLVNSVTEAVLGPNAVLEHVTLQDQGLETSHVAHVRVDHAPSSQSKLHLFSIGARLARNEAAVVLGGEGSSTEMNGLFLARGVQHVDNHTLIDHASPHGSSQEYYKGILDGTAHGTFDGKIVVRREAPKTDAHQKNRNLLLSDGALVDSKPQLEIYNNDVRCTHGSTTGRLDADALFYLRSRGLDETAARALLTLAFAREIVERCSVPELRAIVEERLQGLLS